MYDTEHDELYSPEFVEKSDDDVLFEDDFNERMREMMENFR